MSNTWVTADYHLGEDRFQIMQRPFKTPKEMLEVLVEKHNEKVAKEDTVYVLGDVCYQKCPEQLENIELFNGKKILVRGNHDRVFTEEQLSKHFIQVVHEGGGIELEIEGIPLYLTHYPSFGSLIKFNLVGHIHSAWKFQLNMINVGVDVHHFSPLNLQEIPFYYKAITEFYDDDVWVAYQHLNQSYAGIRGKKGSYMEGNHV